ncbi:MAG: hypothetical protein JSR44_07360 [Spirochaetes bacterium]|nr:hypothetical protein [Spirochaetota bacterium]
MALSDAQKSDLMRRGNTLFNEGRYFEAGKIFAVIGYKTGLIRLGDLFYFEKEMPLVAYGFYRNAQHKPMLDKIGDGFVFALQCLLADDSGVKKAAVADKAEEQLKIRHANPVDGDEPTAQQSKENKIAHAVALLKKRS